VASVATVISMTPGQREVLELGRLSTAFVLLQQIEAVDFYSEFPTPPRALGGN
jgi:hypothetical protein